MAIGDQRRDLCWTIDTKQPHSGNLAVGERGFLGAAEYLYHDLLDHSIAGRNFMEDVVEDAVQVVTDGCLNDQPNHEANQNDKAYDDDIGDILRHLVGFQCVVCQWLDEVGYQLEYPLDEKRDDGDWQYHHQSANQCGFNKLFEFHKFVLSKTSKHDELKGNLAGLAE